MWESLPGSGRLRLIAGRLDPGPPAGRSDRKCADQEQRCVQCGMQMTRAKIPPESSWKTGTWEARRNRLIVHRPIARLRCRVGSGSTTSRPRRRRLGAEDSFPVGPTLLYQAFAPMSPRSVGPGSSLRAGGRRSAGAGEELADSSRVDGNGRSGKDGAVTTAVNIFETARNRSENRKISRSDDCTMNSFGA